MGLNDDRAAPRRPWGSRPYRGEKDLRQMRGLLMEGRALTDDWRYPHVGDLQWWFFMVECHLDPAEQVRLWHDGEKLAGYAILGEDPSFDWQVLPEHEGGGIEAEALAWAEARLAELGRRDPQEWSGEVVSGARQDGAGRIAFLERNGFRRAEYAEVNMLRRLDGPIPEPVLPPGWQVRAVEAGDVPERAAAQREVWQPYTVGDVSDDDYARFMALPGYARELDVVAVTPGGVIGAYVNGWLDPANRIGDLGPVGARAAYRRQGLTRAVLLECLRRMQACGMERVSVSTGMSNTAARNLYESVGFKPVNAYWEYRR